jgi:hypothetical protein
MQNDSKEMRPATATASRVNARAQQGGGAEVLTHHRRAALHAGKLLADCSRATPIDGETALPQLALGIGSFLRGSTASSQQEHGVTFILQILEVLFGCYLIYWCVVLDPSDGHTVDSTFQFCFQ